MNSRQKGKRGELEFRDVLRAEGFDARRGQQFSGGTDSPDVVCPDLDWVHFEVKRTEALNLYDAVDQAKRDCGRRVPIVVHRRSNHQWVAIIPIEELMRFFRGDYPPDTNNQTKTNP